MVLRSHMKRSLRSRTASWDNWRNAQWGRPWQNQSLKKFYTFLFVDCLYVTIRKDYETKNYAVYVILGYDVDGQKDIPGLWLSESESKHQWMQIFDEIKARGVEDVLFLSMDCSGQAIL